MKDEESNVIENQSNLTTGQKSPENMTTNPSRLNIHGIPFKRDICIGHSKSGGSKTKQYRKP